MKYTYMFSHALEEDKVQQLIDITMNYEKVDIYFSGPGGNVSNMRVLINYLNGREGITIYVDDYIGSCSSLLIFKYLTCPIVITKDFTEALFHKMDITLRFQRQDGRDRKYIKKWIKDYNRDISKWLKDKVTKKQRKKYDKGYDLVINRDQIISTFCNKKNISYE